MRGPWRQLLLAAAINVTVGAGMAGAQTVMIKNAPSGSPVELSYNGKSIATATADARGQATLPVNLQANAGRPEVDARIFVDLCPKQQRVLLIRPGLEVPAPAEGCDRHEIAGVFALRGVTTVVADLTATKPSVWLRQGPVPPTWLSDQPIQAEGPTRLAPAGLVVFGGGGIGYINNVVREACGDTTECAGKSTRLAYSVGAAYWFNRYLGVQVNFLKPSNITAAATETSYKFDSALDARIINVAANVGAPIGPVRIYGLGGVNYHRATFSTTETINDLTYTVDGVTTTVKGGTQTLALQTSGWSWLLGAGLEGWVSNTVALYGEGGTAKLKGDVRGTGEGKMDDRAVYLVAGIKIHIGR